ncbi:MAG: AMP-binding protein, partial [Bacteroidota bacterium]
MQLFKSLEDAIVKHDKRNAFCINNVYYTYHQLAAKISGIRSAIIQVADESERNIGLVTNDDLDTYAAIIAIWFEGRCYVPLSPLLPVDRNETIIEQAGIKTIIDSSEVS